MPAPSAPATLWLVRHGESAANVARTAALAAQVADIGLDVADAEIPLSPLGERQATALGRWFAEQDEEERPTVVLASPYERARRTAALVVEAGGAAPAVTEEAQIRCDERWREKELGLFHALTRYGVEARYPEQWALRQRVGPFYYRPPNGESGADVAFRLRSALDSVAQHYPGERVLVVCHQIVILSARYVLDGLTVRQLDALWRQYDLANCSVTSYRPDAAGRLRLAQYNFTVPLRDEGAPVTHEPVHPSPTA
jgi:broad specificity phosphatase PhoE